MATSTTDTKLLNQLLKDINIDDFKTSLETALKKTTNQSQQSTAGSDTLNKVLDAVAKAAEDLKKQTPEGAKTPEGAEALLKILAELFETVGAINGIPEKIQKELASQKTAPLQETEKKTGGGNKTMRAGGKKLKGGKTLKK